MDILHILEQHEVICDEAYDLLKDKVRNYSGDGDAFTNFRRVEQLQI